MCLTHRSPRIAAGGSLLIALFAASWLSILTAPLAAHGGRRVGPGSVTPPESRERAKEWTNTGKPNGPTTPGPASPGTPSPSSGGTPSAAPRAAGPSTPRGIAVGEDLGRWTYWWDMNQDRFLQLRRAVHDGDATTGEGEIYMGPERRVEHPPGRRPSKEQIKKKILPAILQALKKSSGNRDMTSAALIALAKVDRGEVAGSQVIAALSPFLKSKDQEIRETAAIALGISGTQEALPVLLSLMHDDRRGRALTERTRVDHRTRAFAAYGLGLLASAHADLPGQKQILAALRIPLADETPADRNLPVAALSALALLQTSSARPNRDREALLQSGLATLREYFDKELGRGAQMLQCHALTSAAKLLGRGETARHQRFKKICRQALISRDRADADIQRSAAVALGSLALSSEELKADAIYSEALRDYFKNGRNPQARSFALISLAQIGGTGNLRFLLGVLRSGRKALERPWAGLALGVLGFRMRQKPTFRSDELQIIGTALTDQFEGLRTPQARSAMALALGLCKFTDAAPKLIAALRRYDHQDEFAGFLCVGLALMRYPKARPEIHALMSRSVRRPMLLKQGATALALLRDRRVGPTLLAMLEGGDTNLAKMGAVATAMSAVGDRHSVEPLLRLLADTRLAPLSRAFVMVALGGIADRRPQRWNAPLGRDINYRAAVETLTASGTGVLDIL